MKRLFAALLIFAASTCAALALDQSQVPTKFPTPWASGASCGTPYTANCYRTNPIPNTSQVGVVNCAASMPTGFPPLTWPVAGGCPPFGQDFNGILYEITAWGQWQGAGATVNWDSAYSSAIGGYPMGSIIQSAASPTCFFVNQVDGNTSDPDTGGSGWTPTCPGGGVGATSTEIGGNPNQQAVTTTPFTYQLGQHLVYIAGFTNTAGLKINPNGTGLQNVFRKTQLGASMSVGGETVAGQLVDLQWDGTEFQCLSCGIVQVGQVITFASNSNTAPPGTALANGQCISQTTYADLFAVSGTSYGSCSAGNFAVADLRGSFVSSPDASAGRINTVCATSTPGTRCGAQSIAIQQSWLPNVAPTFTGSTQTWTSNQSNIWQGAVATASPGGAGLDPAALGTISVTVTPAGTISSINGGVTQQPTPTVPPTLFMVTVVKL